MNFLGHLDALAACQHLRCDVCFDLVYLDPPYATGLVFKTRDGVVAYDDKFTVDELIAMLEPRVAAIRDRMSAHSSMFLHLDGRAIYDAKTMCDRIFGRSAHQGEIIWVPGNGAKGKGLPSTHQTILVYSKGEFTWNTNDPAVREPFAEASIGRNFKGKDDSGRVFRDRTVNGKTYRYYADKGKAVGSVWTDIPSMVANTPLGKEPTGYPTQKPERLLERIIVGACPQSGTVADLMCGSGTTLAVAARLGRRFVGCDMGRAAYKTTVARLAKNNLAFELIGGA
jgi:site-specific DNA-methyltransferase (adenine-specific)